MHLTRAGCLVVAIVVLAACTSAGTAARPSPSISPSPVPTDLLSLAGLSSPDLMTPLGMTGTIGPDKVTLLGAYADPVRIVLVARVDPAGAGPGFNLEDDGGFISAGGGGANMPSGDVYQGYDTGPHVAAGQVAHFKAHVVVELPSGNPMTPAPTLVFSFAVRVQTVDHLPTGTPFQLGPFHVTIEHLDITPGFINLEALLGGASMDDVIGPDKQDFVTAIDSSGTKLRTVAGGGGIAAGGASIHFQWTRPTGNGTYSIRFNLNGATHTTPL
jgi:hypothetical protein